MKKSQLRSKHGLLARLLGCTIGGGNVVVVGIVATGVAISGAAIYGARTTTAVGSGANTIGARTTQGAAGYTTASP